MMKAHMAGNATQVHPVHIHLDRFLTHFCGIRPGFGFGRVLDLAEHTAVPLTATFCFSGSVLAFCLIASWTLVHPYILAQLLATPQRTKDPMDLAGWHKIRD
jgi:hypothetical protein